MARQQLPPQITKYMVTDRTTRKKVARYQVTVDAGTREIPVQNEDGTHSIKVKRVQTRKRYDTEKEARAVLARVLDEVARGTHVSSSELTVDTACENWLMGRRVRPTTLSASRHALAPFRQKYGSLPVQKVTKAHIDALINELVAGTLPNSKGKPRRPWGPQTVNPMINTISAVLTGLVKQGMLVRDVAALVDRMPRTKKAMKTFTEAEVRTVLTTANADRNGHAWHLSLSGLRRGEVCGLRWIDIDFDAGRVQISNNRVSVNGKVVEGETKTERSTRSLPLTPALTKALKQARTQQQRERLALGEAYGPGTHVVCDESGQPYHPDTVSNYWQAVCKSAGVTPIRLHDARHTCATLMHLQGVPIAVISAWLGHADSAFTMRTYAHSQDDALALAAASLERLVTSRDNSAI
ncbi:site-specific integrase [Rhodococcus sp. 05-339-2]|uniref:tyrosine-type recombinase/integrase n=1 Tax=Rhodococcoides fascians TaxID=1828 RepID=UPI00050BF829|nr:MULTISPECIES: site-specific integrase [Rhodococcus]OZD85601.1 site-specific integrase [Rhodococcus sp. 05-339-2]